MSDDIFFTEHPLMKYLHLGYSSWGKPLVEGKTLIIPVRELLVEKGFPGFKHSIKFSLAHIILTGVSSSKREITESLGKNKFKETYVIIDIASEDRIGKYFFDLSNPCYEPFGWVEWEVLADDIDVEGIEIMKEFLEE